MIKSRASLVLLSLLLAAPPASAATEQPTNLTADKVGKANFTDPNLINPVGISFSPTGDFWVSDNGTGLTTLYDGTGQPQSLVVTIPPPAGKTGPSAPTGQAFNGSSDFVITENGQSGPAAFIFATDDGTVSAWNPSVDATNAVLTIDNSKQKAVYKGMAIVPNGSQNELMLANFRSGYVEIYDGTFKPIGKFRDTRVPADFAPYNVAVLNNIIYVTYAMQDRSKHDAKPGPGEGFVDEVAPDGTLIKGLITRLALNAPWGIAFAPSSWGLLAGALLVGNFGDGEINVFNPNNGEFFEALVTPDGPLTIKDLWAITPGNDGSGGSSQSLYFTSGPHRGKHGLFGSLTYNP